MTNPTQQLEDEIVAKGAAVAPRITPTNIESNIASEHYFTALDGLNGAGSFNHTGSVHDTIKSASDLTMIECSLKLLTFCVLVLKNGFTVTAESACASPENFNAEIGRKIARENAVQKIWPLMGYELRSKLSQ